MPKRSTRRLNTPRTPITYHQTINRTSVLKRVSTPATAWPKIITSLDVDDFIPSPLIPLDYRPEAKYYLQGTVAGEMQREFRQCFLDGARMGQVQLSISIWTDIFAKVCGNPLTSGLHVADRYNLTWAVLGYTDGMYTEVIEYMSRICL